MFQDISPLQYHCEYTNKKPNNDDYLVIVNKQSLVLKGNEFPRTDDLPILYTSGKPALTYLFSIGNKALYLASEGCNLENINSRGNSEPQFQLADSAYIRKNLQTGWMAFASATALHLAGWYNSHKFCGKCGSLMARKKEERALYCPECHQIEYPKISPVVIVGLINKDKILLTHYAPSHSAYRKYSLVAGFVEIGETLEDTIRREFMEEVKLKVKNIRYVCSQPWGFSDSILMGFFADLDGDDTITVDPDELSDASWFTRETLPKEDSSFSLTWTLIEKFRNGEI